MRFLVDAQLPPALARWLVAQGHEASHVLDHDMLEATDTAIWAQAERLGAVMFAGERLIEVAAADRSGTDPATSP